MRTKELTRVEFLRWLAELDGQDGDSLDTPKMGGGGGEITLAWLDASASSLPLVAVKAAELREFLAFVSTYVGTYAPFTAFFRVIPIEMLEFLPKFSTGGIKEEFVQRALLGAILADAALHTGSLNARLADFSVQACLATSSAAISRSLELGYSNSMTAVVINRWHSVRAALGPAPEKIDQRAVEEFWAVVLSQLMPEANNGATDPKIGEFLREAILSANRGHDLKTTVLATFISDAAEIGAMLRASREDRVRALEQIYSRISSSGLPRPHAEMVLGYAASQVAEGSFAYLPLVMRYEKSHPVACLWFGIFAAVNRRSDVLVAGDCLGRRVWRRVSTTPGLLPTISADMNFEEALLHSAEIRNRKIRTDYPASAEIELLPGVSGIFRLMREAVGGAAYRPARSVTRPDEHLGRARSLVAELSSLLRRIEQADVQPTPSLFPEDDGPQPGASGKASGGKRRISK